MFLAAKRPIAEALREQAQEIEERFPRYRVLAARVFRYPVRVQRVQVQVQKYRKVNLLERFVLRAAAEVSPAPSPEEVAEALGIDPVFIHDTSRDLVQLKRLTLTHNGLRLTAEGSQALSSEKLPETSLENDWYLLEDRVCGTAFFSRQLPEKVDETIENLKSYVKEDLAQFPPFKFDLAELSPRLQEMGLEAHNPGADSFVTQIEPTGLPEIHWKTIGIFVVFDRLAENADESITCEAQSSEGRSLQQASKWLLAQLQTQNVSLKTLCGLSDEDIAQAETLQRGESAEERVNEERLKEVQQQELSQLRLRGSGQAPGEEAGNPVQLIRDGEMRPAFLAALQEAREQIIIYSPWINKQVMDEDFLARLEKLVQQGVRILIGHGIAREESREERPIPPDLLQRLRAMQTAEGVPGIIVEWLGNSHVKELLIDRKIHFLGSQNWLSYRGDRLPRGESMYKVTIARAVEEAYGYLARRFTERAHILWSRGTEEECRSALCILCYLEKEQEAVEWIQQTKRYHLIPFWLTLAQQAIAADHEARIFDPLRTVIKLCPTAIELQDSLRAEIMTALPRALNSMGLKNQELAANLISDCLPELYQLGLKQQ